MNGRAFIDTNIWVYAVDTADPAKRGRALEVLSASIERDYVISVQVLGEFYATVTGKLRAKVTGPDGRAMVERMKQLPVVPIDRQLVDEAIEGTQLWRLSYWDALIVAAAKTSGCGRILSEDMADGGTYGSVLVEDPFRTRPMQAASEADHRGEHRSPA